MTEIYQDKRWALKQGEKIYPYLTTEILQKWIAEGVISDEELIKEEGSQRWKKLSDAEEFKFLFFGAVKEAKIPQNIEQGHSCFIKEKKPKIIFELLQNFVSLGYRTLCITRTYPEEIKEKYNIGKTAVFWLSKEEKDNCISPSDLGRLAHTVTEFIQQRKESIIALEGLEYLITHNDFDKVSRLIDDLAEKVAVSKSRIVISASPETFDEKQIALLERNLELLEVEEKSQQ